MPHAPRPSAMGEQPCTTPHPRTPPLRPLFAHAGTPNVTLAVFRRLHLACPAASPLPPRTSPRSPSPPTALPAVPPPRRPLDLAAFGDDPVRRWYENELGWPTVPASTAESPL